MQVLRSRLGLRSHKPARIHKQVLRIRKLARNTKVHRKQALRNHKRVPQHIHKQELRIRKLVRNTKVRHNNRYHSSC